MKKKRFVIVFGAVMTVLLMISSATAINIPGNKSNFEKSDDENNPIIEEQVEVNNNQKQVIPAGIFFSILIVNTYMEGPGSLWLVCPHVPLKILDLETSSIRYTKTNFLGFKFIFGLTPGHRYEISAYEDLEYSEPVVTRPLGFFFLTNEYDIRIYQFPIV